MKVPVLLTKHMTAPKPTSQPFIERRCGRIPVSSVLHPVAPPFRGVSRFGSQERPPVVETTDREETTDLTFLLRQRRVQSSYAEKIREVTCFDFSLASSNPQPLKSSARLRPPLLAPPRYASLGPSPPQEEVTISETHCWVSLVPP